MAVSTQDRRDRILAHVYQAGHVSIKQFAAELAVSEATVRRDLRSLADSQQVELVYGGAAMKRASDFSFRAKAVRNVEGKRIVGRLAAGLIADGDQVFIDSGTTTFEMAPLLKGRRGLSVIVNSVRLVAELADAPGLSIIQLAGSYRPDRMDTIGPLAISTLDQLRGYQAFIGADGLSMDFGLTASDIESAYLYRLAIRNARQTILLVDHSKFQTPSLYKIVDWEAIGWVVTDAPPSPEWMEFLAARKIDVIVPTIPDPQTLDPKP